MLKPKRPDVYKHTELNAFLSEFYIGVKRCQLYRAKFKELAAIKKIIVLLIKWKVC